MEELITIEEIRRTATLACLAMVDADVTAWIEDLNAILRWVKALQHVNTDKVEPLVNTVTDTTFELDINKSLKALEHTLDINTNTKEYSTAVETNKPDESQELILRNAPVSKCCYFVVPKVLE